MNVTNKNRAEWAGCALAHFAAITGDAQRLKNKADCADAIADLIGDLLHYAKSKRIDPVRSVERGVGMWHAEKSHPRGEPYANDNCTVLIERNPLNIKRND